VPVKSRDAVMRANPNVELLRTAVRTVNDRYMSYIFAMESETQVVSRFFFATATGMSEDPGTGSACANLGGYLQHIGRATPRTIGVDQGEKTGRRCALSLTLNRDNEIFVGGRCVRLGGGTISL
jgi:trans-2,3-dihydro-3-hydroxyanthranilate isomerase